MVTKRLRSLGVALMLAAPALAHADKHYHMKMCNNAKAETWVAYWAVANGQVTDVKPVGITKHAGDRLKPGACATMSFVILTGPPAMVTFNVGDGALPLGFNGGIHDIQSLPGAKQPSGLTVTWGTSSGGEHLTIAIQDR